MGRLGRLIGVVGVAVACAGESKTVGTAKENAAGSGGSRSEISRSGDMGR